MTCSKCGEREPHNGSWCRVCRAAAEVDRRRARGIRPAKRARVVDGVSLCTRCDAAPRGTTAWCLSCARAHARTTQARNTVIVRRWRAEHPERWHLQHRGDMLRRRARLVGGNASLDDIAATLASNRCHYCERETPYSDRTVDHRDPLSRGGRHDLDNLAMACSSCNSRKGARTVPEFCE